MKRFHVHVAVDDLKQSIGFYSALFAAEPTVVKPDYAKWMLDDPRVNFAISTPPCSAPIDYPTAYSKDLKLRRRALSGASDSLRIAAQVCL
jgi:hypothetical protein